MYRDIEDFQQKYPTKEARETALKAMSNEEIDKLTDLCQTIQGKNWYQGFKKPETIFRYELKNAWCMPMRRLEVIDGPESLVSFTTNAFKERLERHPGTGEFTEEIRLSRVDLMRIRDILDDDRLFETEELEDPYGMMILDGYVQEFGISGKGRHIEAHGYNLQACKGDTEHCFHSDLMIRTLEEIGKILIPLGVPEQCFTLVS